ARPFAGRERVGFARHQRVVVAAAVEDESELAHDHTRAEAAVEARPEADHVAVLVDDGEIARVALLIRFTHEADMDWTIERRCRFRELLRHAGPHLERR